MKKKHVKVNNATVYRHSYLSHSAPIAWIPLVDWTGSHFFHSRNQTNVELGCLRQSEGIFQTGVPPSLSSLWTMWEREVCPFETWNQIRKKQKKKKKLRLTKLFVFHWLNLNKIQSFFGKEEKKQTKEAKEQIFIPVEEYLLAIIFITNKMYIIVFERCSLLYTCAEMRRPMWGGHLEQRRGPVYKVSVMCNTKNGMLF